MAAETKSGPALLVRYDPCHHHSRHAHLLYECRTVHADPQKFEMQTAIIGEATSLIAMTAQKGNRRSENQNFQIHADRNQHDGPDQRSRQSRASAIVLAWRSSQKAQADCCNTD